MEVAGSPLPELVKEAFSDPDFQRQIRGLEAMLRARERSCRKTSCCPQEDAHGDCDVAFGSEGGRPSPGVCRVYSEGLETVQTTVGESNGNPGFLEVIESDFSKVCAGTSASGGARTAHAIADESQRIVGLLEDIEFDSSKHLVQNPASLHATAGESKEITRLLEVRESDCMRAGAAVAAAFVALIRHCASPLIH